MILSEFSDLIVVDQLKIENDGKYLFFLSHLSTDFEIDDTFEPKIYTSTHIANCLSLVRKTIPARNIEILKNGAKKNLHLANGHIVTVTMFKDEEPSGNVLFHFETECRTALYLGHFKQISKLIWNRTFIDLASKGINYLYIDNSNSNSIHHSMAFDIGYKVKELLKSHTQIIINTPQFGYEELIKTFVLDFKFKIYIREITTKSVFYKTNCTKLLMDGIKDCEIAMIMDSADLDVIEKRLKLKNIATVRLFDFQEKFEKTKYEKIGLYQLSYSSHISLMEMFSFINLIQPEYIKEIYEEFPPIPNFVKAASKRWNRVAETTKNSPSYEDLFDIENFAAKTKLNSPEQLASFIEDGLSENQSTKKSENIEKSTDCEEVSVVEGLSEKLELNTLNIPRRRKIKATPIIIDSNFEEHLNVVKKSEIEFKSNSSPKKQHSNKNGTEYDEFATLMHTNLSNLPYSFSQISEESEFNNFTNSLAIQNSQKLEDEKLHLEQKQKEENETYFSFLDNSVSSKDRSDDDEETETARKNDKISEKLNTRISYTFIERMEELHRNGKDQNLKTTTNDKIDKRNETNSQRSNTGNSSKLIEQQMENLHKFGSVSKNFDSKIIVDNDKNQSIKDKNSPLFEKTKNKNEMENKVKENSEPQPVSITFSLIENKFEIAKKENLIENLLDESIEIEKTKKDYNPFRKHSFVSENSDRNSFHKLLREKKNKTNSKIVEEDKNSKRNITNYLRKSSTQKKRKSNGSDKSVEAIENGNDEIIEIVDNSPPRLRKTRNSTSKTIIDLEKRKVKKAKIVPKLYIDDDDE